MAINIYQVQADAQEKGWTVVSEQYKNLKTPLEYICPKGHILQMTYEEWRKAPECPECHKEAHGNAVRNKILPRPVECKFRILSLDAATGTTGWAIYDDKKLSSYGTYTASGLDTVSRTNAVKRWLDANIKIWRPDGIGIENIQLEHGNVNTFQKLANLQGVLIDYCYENDIKYCLAYPSTWRSFIGINHCEEREDAKKTAQNWVKMMYDIKATQDEADAISMGKYFYNELQKEKKPKVSWGEDV